MGCWKKERGREGERERGREWEREGGREGGRERGGGQREKARESERKRTEGARESERQRKRKERGGRENKEKKRAIVDFVEETALFFLPCLHTSSPLSSAASSTSACEVVSGKNKARRQEEKK